MSCNYCGLPTPEGGEFHPICRLEVGPLHSCPDCNTSPCAACAPEVTNA